MLEQRLNIQASMDVSIKADRESPPVIVGLLSNCCVRIAFECVALDANNTRERRESDGAGAHQALLQRCPRDFTNALSSVIY